MKRILIQDYAGHPFQVQLSRKLAQRGHHILHLYAGYNQTPHGSLQPLESDPSTFAIQGVFIHKPLEKYHYIKRWFQENEYGRLVLKPVADFRPDAVISANMPLDPQARLQNFCFQNKIPFIFWLQDVISLATKKILGDHLPLLGKCIGQYYVLLERRILRHSQHIIAISEGYLPFLSRVGIPPDRITIIPNWAPLDELPILPKDNPWSRALGLANKFCFLYAGTLGYKHKPELLLHLAQYFQKDPQVIIYVGSEGPGADWLARQKNEHNLPNLLIQGYQPMSHFPQVLAAGDVLVALLEPEAGAYSVPSKVLSYLAVQKPLLLAIPANNLAATLVSVNQAGFVVDPADSTRLIAKAQELFSNPLLRHTFAHNARRFAQQYFDIEKIADRFEALI